RIPDLQEERAQYENAEQAKVGGRTSALADATAVKTARHASSAATPSLGSNGKAVKRSAMVRTWARSAPPTLAGGVISAASKFARRKKFLVPVRPLAKHFRGRFLHLARRALPDIAFPEIPRGKSWIVFAKPVVQGAEKVLEYLGRYVHRTAT